jgi:DHA2 family multidrug resistance protein
MMSRFDLAMTAQPIAVSGFVMGFGQSLMFNPLALLSYATLESEHRTEAAVFSTMFRTAAGSLGIAAMQAGLLRQNAAAHEALSSRISPADPLVNWALGGRIGSLEALNAEVTRQGSMMAYDSIFAWMSLGSLALIPLILMLKPQRSATPPLREIHAD